MSRKFLSDCNMGVRNLPPTGSRLCRSGKKLYGTEPICIHQQVEYKKIHIFIEITPKPLLRKSSYNLKVKRKQVKHE